jgi:cytochrome d ubiquinol oxidase subunit I
VLFYTVLAVVEVYLMLRAIRHGPDTTPMAARPVHAAVAAE